MISEGQPADIRRPFAERPRPLVFPAIDALTRISGGASDAVNNRAAVDTWPRLTNQPYVFR